MKKLALYFLLAVCVLTPLLTVSYGFYIAYSAGAVFFPIVQLLGLYLAYSVMKITYMGKGRGVRVSAEGWISFFFIYFYLFAAISLMLYLFVSGQQLTTGLSAQLYGFTIVYYFVIGFLSKQAMLLKIQHR